MQDDQLSAPKKALDNFWYHYKWPTLVVVFVAIFLIIAIGQMVDRTDYDAHMMYAGAAYLDRPTVEALIESVNMISGAKTAVNDNPADANGDGVFSLDFNKLVYVSQEKSEEYIKQGLYYNAVENSNVKRQFDTLIVVGEYVILLLDPSLYEETVSLDIYAPWEETIGYRPDGAYDDYGIQLSELPLYATGGFCKLPGDTVLCCRAKSYISNFNKNIQEDSLYQAERALFKQLITYAGEG